MIDSGNDEGGITLGVLASRLDDLTREVRRQARASVAAQAAAESCLEKLSKTNSETNEEGRGEAPDLGWVQSLLPVADALDRVVAQASALVERPARPTPEPAPARGGLFSFFARAPRKIPPEPTSDAGLRAVVEGLRVLRSQLGAALESSGVTADRRVGVPVDPEVHRVVEVRAPRGGEREDVVLEVVRPGYAARGRVIREAEIVAARRADRA